MLIIKDALQVHFSIHGLSAVVVRLEIPALWKWAPGAGDSGSEAPFMTGVLQPASIGTVGDVEM